MLLSVKDIADNANMIINGYAYIKDGAYRRKWERFIYVKW